jgi:hypothetical protein
MVRMSHIATLDPVLSANASLIGQHLPPWAHYKLNTLYDYWLQQRRGTSRLPSRRDIDPADFPTLLSNVFLLNVNERESRFTYRVAGQKLSWLHQTPLTGRPLGTGLTEDHGAAAISRALDVVRWREPAWRSGDLGWCGRGYLDFQELVLPLGGPEGDVTMLFGILVVIDPLGKEC